MLDSSLQLIELFIVYYRSSIFVAIGHIDIWIRLMTYRMGKWIMDERTFPNAEGIPLLYTRALFLEYMDGGYIWGVYLPPWPSSCAFNSACASVSSKRVAVHVRKAARRKFPNEFLSVSSDLLPQGSSQAVCTPVR